MPPLHLRPCLAPASPLQLEVSLASFASPTAADAAAGRFGPRLDHRSLPRGSWAGAGGGAAVYTVDLAECEAWVVNEVRVLDKNT